MKQTQEASAASIRGESLQQGKEKKYTKVVKPGIHVLQEEVEHDENPYVTVDFSERRIFWFLHFPLFRASYSEVDDWPDGK